MFIYCSQRFLLTSVLVNLVLVFYQEAALCQSIQSDNTLGPDSSFPNADTGVEINGKPVILVQKGAQRGSNLFHSFESFGVDEGKAVYFDNPSGVSLILTRVTGAKRTDILGTLGVYNGTADLFLINPHGINFGPNASLSLNGSFLATTATSLSFPDGQFDAKAPLSEPLLSSKIPTGVRFGETPGSIVNQSRALGLSNGFNVPSGLQIQPGRTLALIGGEVELNNGVISAASGRVEIGSIAGADQVGLSKIDKEWSVQYSNQKFNDIQLLQSAEILAPDGGIINLKGQNITIANNSTIDSISTSNSAADGTIDISATDTFKVLSDDPANPSAVIAQTYSNQRGGGIKINAKDLLLVNGSHITSATFNNGDAGDISVTAVLLDFIDGSYIEASSNSYFGFVGKGVGGNIQIGSPVAVSQSINISGFNSETQLNSGFFSQSSTKGKAGNIVLYTKDLNISDNGEISASGNGSGSAGNININAHSIRLKNQGFINAETTAGSGNITLNASNIFLANNSNISTSATGDASGGNINIATGVLVGLENSNISANAEASSGGNVEISAKGIFGFISRTSVEIQQTLGTSDLSLFDSTDSNQFPTSDVTAISQASPALDGQVILNTPNVDPSKELVNLPTTVVDPSALVAQTPCKRGLGSELTRSGRGGLPPSAMQDLNGTATEIGLIAPSPSTSAQKKAARLKPNLQTLTLSQSSVVPAQGWVFDPKGNVVLVATAFSADSTRPYPEIAGCPVR
jgi:filamentous hemagglutinin family protein